MIENRLPGDDVNDVTGHYMLHELHAHERISERDREIARTTRDGLMVRALARRRAASFSDPVRRRIIALTAPIAGVVAVAVAIIG